MIDFDSLRLPALIFALSLTKSFKIFSPIKLKLNLVLIQQALILCGFILNRWMKNGKNHTLGSMVKLG